MHLFLDDADLFTAERDAQSGESTNFVFNPNRSLNLAAQREKLPIHRYKNEILFCLENFQTLVIVGMMSRLTFSVHVFTIHLFFLKRRVREWQEHANSSISSRVWIPF